MISLIIRFLLMGAAIVTLIPSLFILIECIAGRLGMRRRKDGPVDKTRLLVIIPAHNEESGVGATCTEIQVSVATDMVDARIVVIADNCTDNTAESARATGVTVLERNDPDQQGKGYALAWAAEALSGDCWDGLVVLDADARTAPGFFAAIAAELSCKTHAMQAFYDIEASHDKRSALMQLAFSLINGARPLGRYALGGSASITGNGFALSRQCLEDVPFEPSAALAEDLEHGLALVTAGYRVKLLVNARVSAAPAVDDAGTLSQRTRWEAGRLHALRRWLLPLLRRHTWAGLESALDLLIPPLAVTTLFQILIATCALAAGQLPPAYLAAAGPAVTLLSLILACRLMGLPLRTLFVLKYAVWYLFWKSGIYLHKSFWRQKAWVRTARPS